MWFRNVLIVLLVVEAIGYVYIIGKPRSAVTPEVAVLQIIWNGLLIVGLLLTFGK